MVPVLTAAAGLVGADPQALEHGSLLLLGHVVDGAGAEPVAEVLVVLVVRVGRLGVDAALGVGRGVEAQGAWLVGGEARGAAVAGKVALLEDLDELVLAVALDGAGVTDAGGRVGGRVVGIGRRRVTG